MTPFTKQQKKVILFLFFVLFALTGFNMNISIRRGRDNQRKNDLSVLQKALDVYQNKHGEYPPSIDNKIGACKGPIFVPCEWGKDKFEILSTMPRDPSSNLGREYLYLSNIKGYKIYISLEGKDEAEYTKAIEDLGLLCGNQICNYGREYNFE